MALLQNLWIRSRAVENSDPVAEILPTVLPMLTVSITELDRLGRKLQDAAGLIKSHAGGDLSSALSRDGEVSKAIISVERDWSKQRTDITKYLTAMGRRACDAAALYAAIEEQIRAAAIPAAVKVQK